MASSTRSSIPLTIKKREALIAMLHPQLLTLIDLRTQVYQAHWNVEGAHFISYHKLFEELASMISGEIDSIAERITALGGKVSASPKNIAQESELEPLSSKIVKDSVLIRALKERYQIVAQLVRKNIDLTDDLDDDLTEDMLIGLGQAIEKSLWFLDATTG